MVKLYCDRCGREIEPDEKYVVIELNGKSADIKPTKAIKTYAMYDKVFCRKCSMRKCSETVWKAIAEA